MSSILAMLSNGMSAREIATVFPELSLEDIRNAVLEAAELLKDPDRSLPPARISASAILEELRRHADLSEDDAMEMAVEETRAYRREKAARR